ncbi:MAG: hypothetical protein ABIJ40_19125 [Bacteroidota bacterium]
MKNYTIIIFLFLNSFNVSAQEKDLKLKVVTINVWSGLNYNGVFRMGDYETKTRKGERFNILVSQIKELDPDIIFLQEANPVKYYSERLDKYIFS